MCAPDHIQSRLYQYFVDEGVICITQPNPLLFTINLWIHLPAQSLLNGIKRTTNRTAQALRLAAAALHKNQSVLGAYFRRPAARVDRAKAITAVAHKLARLIYTLLTKGTEYTDKGQDYHEERYRQRVMHHLTQRAEKPGMQLVPVSQSA